MCKQIKQVYLFISVSKMTNLFLIPTMLLLLFNSPLVDSLKISFEPNDTVTVHMEETVNIEYSIKEISNTEDGASFLIYSENTDIAALEMDIILVNPQVNSGGTFNLTGIFLGRTVISCKNIDTEEQAEGNLNVIVIREQRIVDTLFTASVATFVAIIYINFGCALNWNEFPLILKKPIGPTIGFCGQFILMPLLSYGIGQLLFPGNPEMQLGMFFTGVAPGGGASNIWTVLLDGNMSLSITMTTISTIAAFGMMPLWIFTLGKVIFDSGDLDVPYTQITTYVVALIIPLAIGYLIQRHLKKVAQFMARILKGFSTCLILFIIIFAIVTNLYLFQLFSWQIVVAGMALPWLGYVLSYLVGKFLRQPPPDCITIAVEVGIQNTGISIFLLRFALPQPQADLTTVVPVSVAMLTPFPLLFLFIYKKIKTRLTSARKLSINQDNKEDCGKSNNATGVSFEQKIVTES